jgi:hypothetical protein
MAKGPGGRAGQNWRITRQLRPDGWGRNDRSSTGDGHTGGLRQGR